METLVNKLNDYTVSHFKMQVKDFIENGFKKGRHWYYIKDSLCLTEKKFESLLLFLGIDVEKAKATKQDFHSLFKENEKQDEVREEEAESYAY